MGERCETDDESRSEVLSSFTRTTTVSSRPCETFPALPSSQSTSLTSSSSPQVATLDDSPSTPPRLSRLLTLSTLLLTRRASPCHDQSSPTLIFSESSRLMNSRLPSSPDDPPQSDRLSRRTHSRTSRPCSSSPLTPPFRSELLSTKPPRTPPRRPPRPRSNFFKMLEKVLLPC